MAKVAIMGFGTVGSGVYEILSTKNFKKALGEDFEVKRILDIRDFDEPKGLFTKEFEEIKDVPYNPDPNQLAYPNMTIRGTKADTELYTSGLAVLNRKESYLPSTLLELGFITNDNDLLMLKSQWWQDHAAQAIADAVVKAHEAGIYKVYEK